MKLAKLYNPTVDTHALEPTLAAINPVGHAEQEVCPGWLWKNPVSQGVQTLTNRVLSKVEKVPAGQGVQELFKNASSTRVIVVVPLATKNAYLPTTLH